MDSVHADTLTNQLSPGESSATSLKVDINMAMTFPAPGYICERDEETKKGVFCGQWTRLRDGNLEITKMETQSEMGPVKGQAFDTLVALLTLTYEQVKKQFQAMMSGEGFIEEGVGKKVDGSIAVTGINNFPDPAILNPQNPIDRFRSNLKTVPSVFFNESMICKKLNLDQTNYTKITGHIEIIKSQKTKTSNFYHFRDSKSYVKFSDTNFRDFFTVKDASVSDYNNGNHSYYKIKKGTWNEEVYENLMSGFVSFVDSEIYKILRAGNERRVLVFLSGMYSFLGGKDPSMNKLEDLYDKGCSFSLNDLATVLGNRESGKRRDTIQKILERINNRYRKHLDEKKSNGEKVIVSDLLTFHIKKIKKKNRSEEDDWDVYVKFINPIDVVEIQDADEFFVKIKKYYGDDFLDSCNLEEDDIKNWRRECHRYFLDGKSSIYEVNDFIKGTDPESTKINYNGRVLDVFEFVIDITLWLKSGKNLGGKNGGKQYLVNSIRGQAFHQIDRILEKEVVTSDGVKKLSFITPDNYKRPIDERLKKRQGEEGKKLDLEASRSAAERRIREKEDAEKVRALSLESWNKYKSDGGDVYYFYMNSSIEENQEKFSLASEYFNGERTFDKEFSATIGYQELDAHGFNRFHVDFSNGDLPTEFSQQVTRDGGLVDGPKARGLILKERKEVLDFFRDRDLSSSRTKPKGVSFMHQPDIFEDIVDV